MASSLSQFQMMKSASDRLVVAIEDVSDLWPVVRENFEARVPFRRVILNNKARNPVLVEKLPVEYILTTDARLRGRTPLEQSPFWFRHPYASVVLVACEDLDEYKQLLKPRLKQIVQNEDREWFIVFVSKTPANDPNFKHTKKVYLRLEADFSSKKRERCCKLETHIVDPTVWEDIEHKVVVCIQHTLDRRVQFYEEEVRRLSEHRFMPAWNFCNFFVVKESLAIMFEMAHLLEDALREYDELEQIYLEIVNSSNMKAREFGGTDAGDERSAILDASRKPFAQFQLEDAVKEFDFRQYLFARQAVLLFYLNRPAEVAARAFPFIMAFSRSLLLHEKKLPFCLRELWVLTACLAVVKASAERFTPRSVTPDVEKDFYRLQADLYLYARTKLMRLADLVGYGSRIEKSPCNSAALSMSPWPKPAVWPPVPADAGSRILAKQQSLTEKPDAINSMRRELPLAPGILLREANRRRASLSAGNILELMDSNRNSFKEGFKRSESMGEDGRSSLKSSHLSSSNGNLAAEGASVNSPRSVPPSPPTPGLTHARSASPLVPPLSPTGSWGSIDRPMKLGEIQIAAEDALKAKDCDESLQKALSSVAEFEELYLELTRAAADNFHRSWRKRHGVVLDGEVAAVHYRRGNLDSAAKLYEKVCALYAGERWHALLAEVLPRLSDCQRQLGDWAGYLSSCIKLLSLDRGLLTDEERRTLQSEIVRLAHSGLRTPVSLDVSVLITFTSKGGPPLELCEGDPGTLQVTVWSGFPDDISLESLSLTLVTTFSADEGAKVVKSADAPVLNPGKNSVSILLPPQRPGSYVLGVLTGHIGEVKLRSHTCCYTSASSCKGGPPDSDDYLSQEKPIRPVLEVSKPRALVSAQAAVSWRLLIGEPQWVGIVVEPLDYSLEGALVTISAGPGLDIDLDQTTCLEVFEEAYVASTSNEVDPSRTGSVEANGNVDTGHVGTSTDQPPEPSIKKEVVHVKGGQVELPNWASRLSSVLWLRVIAHVQDENSGAELLPLLPTSPRHSLNRRLSSSKSAKDVVTIEPASEAGDSVTRIESSRQATSTAEGMRTVNVKLDFGAGRSRTFERAIAVQFTKPFRTLTRVVSKGNDGTLILQVTLISELVASITILDARLELQAGFIHVNGSDGRPSPSWLVPLQLSATSEGALLFVVRSTSPVIKEGSAILSNGPIVDTSKALESQLIVQYKISGERRIGAHAPVRDRDAPVFEDQATLTFTNSFILQMPVLEQLVAIGMLPVPIPGPRVGQQVIFQWRIERLKEGCIKVKNVEGDGNQVAQESLPSSSNAEDMEELEYELQASTENWMVAGRKKGNIVLSSKMGARVVISMACVPLVAGHVHPPSLCLANISRAHISSSPAGPHIVCVLPPALCSTLCASKVL
ncbi:trafficking protein particle complex subunit 10 [Marchantia polymorpha subsp. ruderalis]|uniref:Uncharacterized protein n=1 Tax=Marchantia polymorpha TaxID=3197 RepID=A0A2R6X7U8_MARPO|nr:hypothetical protein MARPO_0031s0138 [Marchantia polymorpha]BBN01122.1 hypothetical protein Mp_2g04830 [Marchantia polymorpha subsp. ruderalis]|eukprot:PTQ42171.1 hypothetical protein MARPO_0031s0138 [Marchantia polymorpha]